MDTWFGPVSCEPFPHSKILDLSDSEPKGYAEAKFIVAKIMEKLSLNGGKHFGKWRKWWLTSNFCFACDVFKSLLSHDH